MEQCGDGGLWEVEAAREEGNVHGVDTRQLVQVNMMSLDPTGRDGVSMLKTTMCLQHVRWCWSNKEKSTTRPAVTAPPPGLEAWATLNLVANWL